MKYQCDFLVIKLRNFKSAVNFTQLVKFFAN